MLLAVVLVTILVSLQRFGGRSFAAPRLPSAAPVAVPPVSDGRLSSAPPVPPRQSLVDEDPAAEERVSCTVLVVDERGGARQARVFLVTPSDDTRFLGSTDGRGRVEFVPPSPPFTLVAEGEDIQTRELRVEAAAPVIQMVVRDGTRASGRVVLSGSGDPAHAGTRVVAWPRSWRFPPRELARRVLASDPRVLSARTDETGSFELTGLGAGVSYSALAVAPGWCTWPSSVLAVGDDNVLVMQCILGVRVVVREPGGEPLRTGPLRAYGRTCAVQPGDFPGVTCLTGVEPISELMGAGRPPAVGDPTRGEFLFACPGPRVAVGPIGFPLDIPGYSLELVDVWARPTDQGIPEQVIEAIPTSEERRDLWVEFVNVPDAATAGLATCGGVGKIVLSSGHETLFADIDDLTRPLVLRSVPRSLQLESVTLSRDSNGPPCERTGVTEDAEHWSVDLGELQALVLDLVQPDESLYQGPALIALGIDEDTFGTIAFFERAPYVLFSSAPPSASVLLLTPPAGVRPLEESSRRRRVRIDWP